MSSEDQSSSIADLNLDEAADKKVIFSKYFANKNNSEFQNECQSSGTEAPSKDVEACGTSTLVEKSSQKEVVDCEEASHSQSMQIGEEGFDTIEGEQSMEAGDEGFDTAEINQKMAAGNENLGTTQGKHQMKVGDELLAGEIKAKETTESASNDCQKSDSDDLLNKNQEQNDEAESSEGEPIQYTPQDFESESSDNGDEDNKTLDADDVKQPESMKEEDKQEENKAPAARGKSRKKKKRKGKSKAQKQPEEKSSLFKRYSDKDTENYRNGYPGQKDNLNLNANLKFYRNELRSTPDGDFIDVIHKRWFGEYALLERHHGYIQWLFPIRESGMNCHAQPLQLHEAEAIKSDPEAKKRVLESYELMLDFYGMELQDVETGELRRSKNWHICFENLNRSSHNYLRITRILKCLGELGFEPLKKGFIKFVLDEAVHKGTLVNTLNSCRDYWIGTIKNDRDRTDLHNYLDQYNKG